jgi:hypothetical protein
MFSTKVLSVVQRHVPTLTRRQMYAERITSLEIDKLNLNAEIAMNTKRIAIADDARVVSGCGIAISLWLVESWIPGLACTASFVISDSIKNKMIIDNIKNIYDERIIDTRIVAAKESLANEERNDDVY